MVTCNADAVRADFPYICDVFRSVGCWLVVWCHTAHRNGQETEKDQRYRNLSDYGALEHVA
jgi:hypothetical protein